MKTITLTTEKYQALKNISIVCLGDKARMALCGIYYDADKKRATACDGHIMRWEQIDLGPESMLIDPCYFKQAVNSWSKQNNIVNGNEIEVNIPTIEVQQYPDIDKVVPEIDDWKIDNNAPCVAVNAECMQRICRSFEKNTCFVMIPTGSFGALMIIEFKLDKPKRLAGLIMPVRIDSLYCDMAYIDTIKALQLLKNEPRLETVKA